MRISDLIRMCVSNLARRKVRTMLTVMGVVIGTCAIVVMISLGVGINVSQEQMLEGMGDLSIIEVYGSRYSNEDGAAQLTDATLAQIQAMDGVKVATPFMRSQGSGNMMLFGGNRDRYSMYMNAIGVYPQAMDDLGFKYKEGVGLPEGKTKKIPVVFGSEAAYEFEDTKKKRNNRIWPEPDENGNLPDPYLIPMESELVIKLEPQKEGAKTLEFPIEVVGVFEGDYSNYETIYGVFMRIEDIKAIQTAYEKENSIKKDKNESSDSYDNVKVKAVDINQVKTVEDALHEMGFTNTWSMASIREELQASAQQIQLILGGLGAISLFVAAISITNTMIMSVYERTREIGVMKVLGCFVSNIRAVFLIEAGLIGFFGGVIGIGLSYTLSYLMNTFGGSIGGSIGMGGMAGAKLSIIPPWLVLLGMGFATGIGLVSGFYPANRAVKISALEAIRQE